MDLESYALTAQDQGDVYSPAGTPAPVDRKGKGRDIASDSSETQPASAEAGDRNEEVTFEKDVRQLAQNVTSWWSGFSKKSQEHIASAQNQIAAQGGIVNFARNEASKIEAQLEETRKKARMEREEADRLEREAREQEQEREKDQDPADRDSTERAILSNADARQDSAAKVDVEAAAQAPDAAGGIAGPSTFLARLQTLSADPRVATVQSDLSARLNTLFTQSNAQTQNLSRSVQSTLQEVSSSLSKISGPEGKAYASRYIKASEELMGKVGEEWQEMMGELVKVVPASSGAAGAHEVAATAEASDQHSKPATATTPTEKSDQISPSNATTSNAPMPSSHGTRDDEDAFSWEEAGHTDTSKATSSSGVVSADESSPGNEAMSSAKAAGPSDEDAKLQTSTRPPTDQFEAQAQASDEDSDWE